MSRRMEIELTSELGDGSWTWRAAGAKEPKGVLDGTLLPAGSSVGDALRVEVDQEIDGLVVMAVVPGRQKTDRREMLELIVSDEPFEPVTEKRATRRGPDAGRRGDRRRGDAADDGRRDRRDRRERRRDDDRPRTEGEREGGRAAGPHGERRGDRPGDRPGDGRGDRRRDGRREDRRRSGPEGENRQPRRPAFTPPPEVPTRPKPHRLKPGRAHRAEVLESIPVEQRPIAEVAAEGMAAVRQRLQDENRRLAKDGKPTMPEDAVVQMAERLIPRLRLADWLDRADAARATIDTVDLRDLRSVLAASTDPIIARDERARHLTAELHSGLARRQEAELELWYGDIDASLAVGRVIRALRLSSQPPKAGVPFPLDLAKRLALGANAALVPTDPPERWIGVLEAAAFSPIRSLIQVARPPDTVSDDLRATVTRLGPALPQIAAAFEIEVPAGATMPRPLRPDVKSRAAKARPGAATGRPGKVAARPEKVAASPKPAEPSPDVAPAADAVAVAAEEPVEPTSDVAPAADAVAAEEPVEPSPDVAPAADAAPAEPTPDAVPADDA